MRLGEGTNPEGLGDFCSMYVSAKGKWNGRRRWTKVTGGGEDAVGQQTRIIRRRTSRAHVVIYSADTAARRR